MTNNDKWGSEWPDNFNKAADKAMNKAEAGHDKTPWPSEAPKKDFKDTFSAEQVVMNEWFKNTLDMLAPKLTGLDLASGERTVLTTFESDGIKHRIISQTELKSQGSNLVDDQAYLYFQCESCNEIFDPHTKSFAKLQEKRAEASWHVKWNMSGMGYKVYCAECGEKV